MNQFSKQALIVGLEAMFRRDWFSISDLDNLIALAGVAPDGETYRALRPLHCVNWRDMPIALRRDIKQRVLGIFRDENRIKLTAEDFLPSDLDHKPPLQIGWLSRIFGGNQ